MTATVNNRRSEKLKKRLALTMASASWSLALQLQKMSSSDFSDTVIPSADVFLCASTVVAMLFLLIDVFLLELHRNVDAYLIVPCAMVWGGIIPFLMFATAIAGALSKCYWQWLQHQDFASKATKTAKFGQTLQTRRHFLLRCWAGISAVLVISHCFTNIYFFVGGSGLLMHPAYRLASPYDRFKGFLIFYIFFYCPVYYFHRNELESLETLGLVGQSLERAERRLFTWNITIFTTLVLLTIIIMFSLSHFDTEGKLDSIILF